MSEIGPSGFIEFGDHLVREMRFPNAGDHMEGHRHQFEHATHVIRGAVRFEMETGESYDVYAPNAITAPARVKHRMVGLRPDSIAWCVFAMRDEKGEVTDRAHATSPFTYAQ